MNKKKKEIVAHLAEFPDNKYVRVFYPASFFQRLLVRDFNNLFSLILLFIKFCLELERIPYIISTKLRMNIFNVDIF